ncbi:MAG: ANTAR domain-containing protein [Beijerinckiaceae bacterium]|nr:ANTAR domain-containing protein [Beijerinckiaceae bacterium]
MAPRIVQNFRGGRAVIFAPDGGIIDVLDTTLHKLGISVERQRIPEGQSIVAMPALHVETDIIFVDGDLDVTACLNGHLTVLRSVPIIGLVGIETPGRLKALMNLGASALLRKPVHSGAIYTALFLGINAFMARRDLECRLEEHQRRRSRRRIVVKAIIILMQQGGLDDEEAYAQLRRDSMRARRSLEDYCEDYVNCRSTTTLDQSPTRIIAGP